MELTFSEEFELRKERYQQILIDDYLKAYPEYNSYSRKELLSLVVLSEFDIRFLLSWEYQKALKELASIDRDIESAIETINNPTAFGEQVEETRRDLSYYRKKREEALAKVYEIEAYAQENEIYLAGEDYKNDTGSRH